MPAPLTHIASAVKYLAAQKPSTSVERAEFISGATWPDIRNLGVIDRSVTHSPQGVLLPDITAKLKTSMWEAGHLHHLWLDERWHEVFGIDFEGPENSGLKFVNEQLVWQLIPEHEWWKIGESQRTIPSFEMAWHVPLSATLEWHAIITYLCAQEPTLETGRAAITRIHRTDTKRIAKIIAAASLLAKNEAALTRLATFNQTL